MTTTPFDQKYVMTQMFTDAWWRGKDHGELLAYRLFNEDRFEKSKRRDRQRLLADVLMRHQRITSQEHGPCWCGEWPNKKNPAESWMDHVAEIQAEELTYLEDK